VQLAVVINDDSRAHHSQYARKESLYVNLNFLISAFEIVTCFGYCIYKGTRGNTSPVLKFHKTS
jgi:hypothetical protein